MFLGTDAVHLLHALIQTDPLRAGNTHVFPHRIVLIQAKSKHLLPGPQKASAEVYMSVVSKYLLNAKIKKKRS